jgi:hypothetical protein
MGKKRNACRLSVRRAGETRPLRRHRWVDDIKVDLGEMGWCGMAWADLTEINE